MDKQSNNTLLADDPANTTSFIAGLERSPYGFCKEASEAATHLTRRILREDSFTPAIIPFENITKEMLHEAVDTESPSMLCEMEAAQAPAISINFHDTADITPYRADKYLLLFYNNSTPVFTKNELNLLTYRNPITTLVKDNGVRDLGRQRDFKFMAMTNEIVGPRAGAVSSLTGLEQYVLYPGRLNRANWVATRQLLNDRSLPNGVALMNKRTFSEFSLWGRDQFGGDMAQDLILKGDSALGKSQLSGIDIIVTLKHDLVANGVCYMYTAPNYLGRAGTLVPPTMYVKKDKQMISFQAMETIGVAIGNVAGVQKVAYQSATGQYGGDGRLVGDAASDFNA